MHELSLSDITCYPMLAQSSINWKWICASMLQSSGWYNPYSNVSVFRFKHRDCFSVTNHKPLGNIWRLHVIKCNWGCGCQPKTQKGMIMGFPVQLLLFINEPCTGGIRRQQAWCTFWLHWGHSPANTWSRDHTHFKKYCLKFELFYSAPPPVDTE